jgi:hypothetical protein
MSEMLYCIKHERMELAHETRDGGLYHELLTLTNDYPPIEYNVCFFDYGWATYPPPELPIEFTPQYQ